MTMLERLARAYMGGRYCSFETWDSERERDDTIAGVRAILTELREPTAGMVEAGQYAIPDEVDYGVVDWHLAGAFKAMIDEVLKESQ